MEKILWKGWVREYSELSASRERLTWKKDGRVIFLKETHSWVLAFRTYTKYVPADRDRRVRASSYEPGNRAGSVMGTNFVVCSYG